MQPVVCGRTGFDEHRQTIGTAPLYAVQHQAMSMHVVVDGGPEALDQRHGAAVPFVGLEPCAVQQLARDHALHHLQVRRDQLRLRGQQQLLRQSGSANEIVPEDLRDRQRRRV